MGDVKIRELLDCLGGDALNRLCELRHLSRRGVDAQREALAHSYHGDHGELFGDLRKEDLVEILGRTDTVIEDTSYYLPSAQTYSRDELVRIARRAFCRDGVPSEFVVSEEEGESDGGDDEGGDDGEDVIRIRDLLDDLDGEAINRLCDLRDLRRRGIDARRQALARSYRGHHDALFDDLRKEDLVQLLGRSTTEIGGIPYYLPSAQTHSRDELVRIARRAFTRSGVPSEFVVADDADEAHDDVSDEDDEEEADEVDTAVDHTSSEYQQSFLRELAYSPQEAATKRAHDYQREAEATLMRALSTGVEPQLLHLATGGGKTLVANNLVVRWLKERGGPVLWVTKDWQLLKQAARDLSNRHTVPLPSRLGGFNRALHPLPEEPSHGVIYTTVHTLLRRLQTNVLRQVKPTLLVWDECHWGEHGRAGKILNASERAGIPVLGLTATPRVDTRYKVAFRRTYHQLVTEGYLARETIHNVRTQVQWAPDFQRLGGQSGDVTQASLKELAGDARRNKVIVGHFLEHADLYRKTIVFACSVEHANELAKLFVSSGVAARPMHYHQDAVVLQQALDMFRTGQVQVLVNIAMLTHGIDVPDAKSVFLCRPTTSDILFAQMIGRACRRDEASGKTTFNVVEFTDNVEAHGALFKYAKDYFGGANAGGSDEAPRSRSHSGFRPRVHAYDSTGAPTWVPDLDIPESMRGLWYRERQTFGIEMELAAPDRVPNASSAEWLRIAEALRLRLSAALPGRVAPDVIAEYQGASGDKDTSVWNIEYDASAGWEVTSRILSDFNGFCEVDDACVALDRAAQELGLKVNYRTGLHVHIGWLGKDVEELKRAVRLAKLFEPALATMVAPSRIAHYPGEPGAYDLTCPNEYCRPVSSVFSDAVLDGLRTIRDFARVASQHDARYVTFNIQPLDVIHTVEIRMHSGTLEARKILPWVSLWMQILWAAANRKDIPAGGDRKVIVPDGDIVALALKYLPDARDPRQQSFLHRLEERRSEIVNLWVRQPELRAWQENATRWVPVPGRTYEM
jgi:superfamily II DNA or RNA helicase